MRTPPLAIPLLLAATMLHAQTKPHEHGAMKIDVAIDGPKLSLAVEMPLANLTGFERAPRSDAERKAAAEAMARMRAGADLFKANAEARCAFVSATVEAPVLEGGKQPAGEHADLDATYIFQCQQPAQLATLDVAVFDAFKRVKRIELQIAGPNGQRKAVLRPPATRVQLAK